MVVINLWTSSEKPQGKNRNSPDLFFKTGRKLPAAAGVGSRNREKGLRKKERDIRNYETAFYKLSFTIKSPLFGGLGTVQNQQHGKNCL